MSLLFPTVSLTTQLKTHLSSIASFKFVPLGAHIAPQFSAVPLRRARLGVFRTMASNSLPKTMKGVWIEKTGGTEVLQYRNDIPVPEPKEGEILVKNEFVGVNYIDT
jgi:hypothetical protein